MGPIFRRYRDRRVGTLGNAACLVDAAAVKEIRGNTTDRNKPWTEDELQRVRR
jgi:hypothetical protein